MHEHVKSKSETFSNVWSHLLRHQLIYDMNAEVKAGKVRR